MSTALSIRNLSVYYDRFRALFDVDIEVGDAQIVAIIGANGAGKSSLLKAIVGQVPRVEGDMRFGDISLIGRPTPDIVAAGVALVPEGRRLFSSLTVEENLDIGWQIGRRGSTQLGDIYRYFPVLAEKRHQRAGELSGGQQQMVALGRALLANPRLLLCDEISLGLAPVIIDSLYAILPEICAKGTAILVVEQDISRSLSIADRFYCLLEGRVSLSGRPGEVSRAAIEASYFGGDVHG
ncbi:ABC transporter ATP-binding protein [Rhizobium halophytocola]|uniref:Branched-chain amino acid transport system ATP-binding protein n=1 Tax=Rhizobium halophytocola TaxID=735519 RepID=A0ABS4E2C4_9HYPH|nr:ABC transporter ATP-binding protein [Rhizobium halophytocola]MBP1852082.1 branched-chain amino acid transport system ATP-binding protein [Rhizobium halophytocola]